MATVRDLIKGSMRLIGAIATGETPSAEELQDALTVLNSMVDSWSLERLNIYAIAREEFTLIPGQQSYTMGPSGNFNTTRPLKIEKALLQDQSSNPKLELPIQILNLDEWASIAVKGTQSSIPTKLMSEGTDPLETVNVWPTPNTANKLVLYTWKPLTSFADLNTNIALPPGYFRALRYNLAVELCPEYGKSASTEIVAGALESKANIKRKNIRPEYLKCDPALVSRGKFNIITGE